MRNGTRRVYTTRVDPASGRYILCARHSRGQRLSAKFHGRSRVDYRPFKNASFYPSPSERARNFHQSLSAPPALRHPGWRHSCKSVHFQQRLDRRRKVARTSHECPSPVSARDSVYKIYRTSGPLFAYFTVYQRQWPSSYYLEGNALLSLPHRLDPSLRSRNVRFVVQHILL